MRSCSKATDAVSQRRNHADRLYPTAQERKHPYRGIVRWLSRSLLRKFGIAGFGSDVLEAGFLLTSDAGPPFLVGVPRPPVLDDQQPIHASYFR
jgi:hypothetical protein